MLKVTIGGKEWYCERPSYEWTRLDLGFVKKGFFAEQKLLFPEIREPLGVFDAKGRWWARRELSSYGLVEYFVEHPAVYMRMMALHTRDVEIITSSLRAVQKRLADPRQFVKHLRMFQRLYQLMYRAQASVFMAFDPLAWEFRKFLLRFLTREEVNHYYPRFLAGEATKVALKKGYVQERKQVEYAQTRGVLYGIHLKPRAFYAEPQFFHAYPEDAAMVRALQERGASQKDIDRFFAFRMIVPLGFQINEEAQYVETAGLSAHLGVLMCAIAKKIAVKVSDLQKMSVLSLIRAVRKK